MTSSPASVRLHRIVLFALWVVFYGSFTLFIPPLLDDADSVHAEVAREILLRHDWTTLYANGIRYLEKAPVLYWSVAASFKLFGVSAAAARLPVALSVLALALVLEAFARRAFTSARAGLYAGLITLSSFGIFIFSRINLPDTIVCLWLTLALYLFWLAEQQSHPTRSLCWLFAATCALDVLTKGLIGIVFPLAIAAAYLLLTRGLAGTLVRLRTLYLLSSTLVFLLIATPWHILAALANPTQGHPGNLAFTHGHWQVPLPTDGNVHGWLWFYFVNEQLLRYLNLRVPRDYDTVPIALFYGLILVWIMPWSTFLIPALDRAFPFRALSKPRFLRHVQWRGYVDHPTNANPLLLLWAAIPLLFFSLSTRQEYYVLPALPALILLLAQCLTSDSNVAWEPAIPGTLSNRRTIRRFSLVLFILGACISFLCLGLALYSHKPSGANLANLLQQNPADYALSFGHFLDLNAQAMSFFRLPLLITAVSLFSSSLANLLLRRRDRPHAANLSLAAGAFGFLFAAHLGLQTFAPILSSEPLARALTPILKPQDLLVLHGEYEAGSTLGFYLRRNDLHIWDGRSSNLWYGSFFSDSPKIFETTSSMQAKWSDPQRIFLWQDPTDRDRSLPPTLTPIYPIAQSGGKLLLSNQPLASPSP